MMKSLITTLAGVLGPYASIERCEGYWLCNGSEAHHDGVVGDATVGEWSPPPPPPEPVPESVNPRQIRRALTRAALRDAVEAAVQGGDQDLKDWWEQSPDFHRANPMVIAMAHSLHVNDDQLDDLFRLAGTL